MVALCTTDDPTDTLAHHKAIAKAGGPGRGINAPTFRPDKAHGGCRTSEAFQRWVAALTAASGVDCANFAGFISALTQRHDYFHSMGGRLSDHGLPYCPVEECSETDAATIYASALSGKTVSREDAARFASYMMLFFGKLDASKNWTKQLHLGPIRNNSSRLFKALGPDTGFDSMGDFQQGPALSKYLDRLDSTGELPRMIP